MSNSKIYRGTRAEIIKEVPIASKNILDVGCAAGDIGLSLKKKIDCQITGIELDEKSAKIAAEKLDVVINGPVEQVTANLEKEYFDCIIFADVLEHLQDPETTLEKCVPLLKSGGSVVISVPNVRYIKVLFDLCILGKWEYKPFGVMDEGHLRFFTKKSIMDLINKVGLTLSHSTNTFSFKGSRLFNFITFGIFTNFLTIQYVFVAKKNKLYDKAKKRGANEGDF